MPTERESPTEAPTDPETPSETEIPFTTNRTGTDMAMAMATATEALTTQGTRPSLPKDNLPNRGAAKEKTNEKNAIYFIQFVAEILRLVTTYNSYFFVFGLICFPFILRRVLLKVQLGITHRWIKN